MSSGMCVHLCESKHNLSFLQVALYLQVLPASREVIPSMVLVFQLVALPGNSSYVSSVLAWGAFPICGPTFSLAQGRWVTYAH